MVLLLSFVLLFGSLDINFDSRESLDLITEDIKMVSEYFVQGRVNINTVKTILGEGAKIYKYNPEYADLNKKRDDGWLYIYKDCYSISLIFKSKKFRDSGASPEKILFIFENCNGIPIIVLKKIFGECVNFISSERTKTPRMYFEKKIENSDKKLYIAAMDIFGKSEIVESKFIRLTLRID